ncbi:MAG: DEAD/DEAH box helicase [Candidatus Contendobacter sp.]|nr:MAG: DEAD/DEAH box helicase [Candidatus Contendobacter sp.]
MIPSLVAQEITEGLRQYLITGFEPANPTFRGIVRAFLDQPGSLYKGPYLSLGLPFRPGPDTRNHFPGFRTAKPPYRHQERAWRRLDSAGTPASTLVATGTGSGKTECFMYPLLDHCWREQQAGRRRGIKALVIYPMNALGSDQARRFAQTLHASPGLRDRIRVGLYIGQGDGGAPGAAAMTATSVITAKEAMRRDPPDILLTNYKMLDYLLIRPRDRVLWRDNGPDTLRYLVVDELHTFDGAQGTDLALLIRRLKARLKTPPGHLLCVGTSATLGDADQAAGLLSYAREIFGEPFADDAVIGEERLTMSEFLAGALIEHQLAPVPDLERQLDPRAYPDLETAIAAWHRLFFPDAPPARPNAPDWRQQLGQQLKGQLQFNNLLRLLDPPLRPMADLIHELPRFLPGPAKACPGPVLDALLALVAWAREPSGQKQEPDLAARPFMPLRLQLWLREQRRMVVCLTADPAQRGLVAADDLPEGTESLYLPLAQCSDCLTSAWLARLPPGDRCLDHNLQNIYDAFFSRRPELALLYPEDDVRATGAHGEITRACGHCGQLQPAQDRCRSCGGGDLVPVFLPHTTQTTTWKGKTRVESEHRCPVCGAEDSLLLFGARATSLSAVAIQHLWASAANDHRKLIAFSDSVQDAAHRAGFFAARTYASNVRAAIVQALAAWPAPSAPWPDFLAGLPGYWLGSPLPVEGEPNALTPNPSPTGRGGFMTPEQFVVEFIGPNMTWLSEYEDLLRTGSLRSDWLREAVAKRLQWEALAEFGYLARRGRSLETVGSAALGIQPERVAEAIARLGPALREGLGLRDLAEDNLRVFVWGFLLHLKRRGAMAHDFLRAYIEQGGRTYILRNLPFLPNFGPHTPRPVFFTLTRRHPEFDTVERSNRITWYQQWVRKALAPDMLLPVGIDAEIYRAAGAALTAAEILETFDSRDGPVLALKPAALFVATSVTRLTTGDGASTLVVPTRLVPHLTGLPALDLAAPGAYEPHEAPEHWLAPLYRNAVLRRVIAAEHTSLLERQEREALEGRFKAEPSAPGDANLLSATPTLEMGVDIGGLSAVLLCSVPPAQANYLQRVGRAGRRDGNALTLTVAAGRPHDLYFYARPEDMMSGPLQPPGVFLNASSVLFRQLTAFCLDHWVATGIDQAALPVKLGPVLDAVERYEPARFPYNFIAFVKDHGQTLFADFCALLEPSLAERPREALADFLFGGDETDSLRVRLVKRLQAAAETRAILAGRARTLRNEIDKLRRAPQDEATANQIETARREREALLAINRQTNGRDLLGFLTDEGLIPNYAFPEEGVTLHSVLWRKRREPVDGESPYEHWVLEYGRPAAAAISELAPLNCFFAGGRRVQVDQIDLTLSPIETWRLCPTCSHAEPLGPGDTHPVCPRCGDPRWADVGQKHALVRLRHVRATTEDSRSRIDDSSDDRDPQFYQRQMLPDFHRDDVELAWRIASDALPFGFEFIRKVIFRDVNFGSFSAVGDTSWVAGREAVRRGFQLCRHCGKVQVPFAGHAEPGQNTQVHAYDCPERDRQNPDALIDCLYLYREFQSEALRILLPVTRTETDSRVTPSLAAAIRLGLKLRFGGKIDHLDLRVYEEPDRAAGVTRRYLLLYDTVPGGTGYLHELLRDKDRLFEVFQLARDRMAACDCRQDATLDGCYRCLFAYRLGASIAATSRDTAITLLSEILDARDQLEPVETLSDILINPVFDSVLEARLIEAFKRRARFDPGVCIQQEVVRGKPGYYLRVGEYEYTVEPQALLGPGDGVTVASKPDFLIRPARAAQPGLPMAVFADGFEYHKHTLPDDTLKRLALIQSGRFWVWSLTWHDIEEALAHQPGSLRPLPPASGGFEPQARRVAEKLGVEDWLPRLVESPFTQLLEWLRQPDAARWSGAVFTRALAWAKPLGDATALATIRDWCVARAPGPLRDWLDPGETALGGEVQLGEPEPALALKWLLPATALKTPLRPTALLALLWLDPAALADEAALRLAWRRFLAAANLLQFLPAAPALIAEGVAAGLYEQAGWQRLTQGDHDAPHPDSSEWQAALAEAVSEAVDGLRRLMAQGIPAPVVGYEWTGTGGAIGAEAELAWAGARLAILRADQAEQAPAWQAIGWTVFPLVEDWAAAVLTTFGRS